MTDKNHAASASGNTSAPESVQTKVPDDCYTLTSASNRSGISERKLLAAIRKQEIEAVYDGDTVFVKKESFDAYHNRRCERVTAVAFGFFAVMVSIMLIVMQFAGAFS